MLCKTFTSKETSCTLKKWKLTSKDSGLKASSSSKGGSAKFRSPTLLVLSGSVHMSPYQFFGPYFFQINLININKFGEIVNSFALKFRQLRD